jgi:predicted RNA binding protein YcfA (HicA-like mRNA interferase family)
MTACQFSLIAAEGDASQPGRGRLAPSRGRSTTDCGRASSRCCRSSRAIPDIRALGKVGWELERVTGSHHVTGHADGRHVSVPVHGARPLRLERSHRSAPSWPQRKRTARPSLRKSGKVCHYRLHGGLSSHAHSGRHTLRCGFACLDSQLTNVRLPRSGLYCSQHRAVNLPRNSFTGCRPARRPPVSRPLPRRARRHAHGSWPRWLWR